MTIDADKLQNAMVSPIRGLRRRGARGRLQLPRLAHIEIIAPAKEHAAIEQILGQSEFEADLSARLANELSVPVTSLPQREYAPLAVGWRLRVKATARTPKPVTLRVLLSGGDRDGAVITLPKTGRVLAGRGPYHDGDSAFPNHIILTHADTRVSRKALVLKRSPEGLQAKVPSPMDRALTHLKKGDHLLSFERMADGCVLTPEDQLVFAEGEITLRLIEEDP